MRKIRNGGNPLDGRSKFLFMGYFSPRSYNVQTRDAYSIYPSYRVRSDKVIRLEEQSHPPIIAYLYLW